MVGGRSSHRRAERLRAFAVALIVASSFTATSAWGFEAFDGRLEAHGAFVSQLRAMNADFSEDWDVAQWYNVFTLELEFDLIQDTVGPIDSGVVEVITAWCQTVLQSSDATTSIDR